MARSRHHSVLPRKPPKNRQRSSQGGWGMNLLGQWIGLIVGVIAIVGQAVQWTWGYAELAGRTQRNTDEIARNFKEDEYNRDRMFKSIERIDATMSGMTQVYVKIGQMETQLANITEILKDLRTQVLERRPTKQ